MGPGARRVACAAAVLGLLAGPVALLLVLSAAGGDALIQFAALVLGVLVVVSPLLVCRLLWPERALLESAAVVWAGLVCAIGAAAIGWLGAFMITIHNNLCGRGGSGISATSWAAEGAVYLIVGSWAFLRPMRPLWGWPLAVLAGVTAALIVQAVIPGGHGFCET